MRLVIDRHYWIRHNETIGDFHCALGFLRVAAGACTLAELKYPWMLDDNRDIDLGDGVMRCLGSAIVQVNDRWPKGYEREQKLIDLFGKVGIDLEFIGTSD
jgi:hypothetical protein